MRAHEISLGLMAAVITALIGAAGARLWQGSIPEGRAAELVPETADLYVSVYVDPSNTQKRALSDLLDAAEDPAATLASELEAVFDPVLTEVGVDYERDIKPWIGREVALFHEDKEHSLRAADAVAILIETSDPAAAIDFVGKVRPRTHLHVGLVEDFVAIGNRAGLQAARAARVGSSLESSAEFIETSELLTEDRVVTIYMRHEFGVLDPDRDGAALYFTDASAVFEGTFNFGELIALPSSLERQLGSLVSLDAGVVSSGRVGIRGPRLSFGSVERDGEVLDQVVFTFR